MTRPANRAISLLLAIIAVATLAGCAAMEAGSDQPWSTQESWEGTISLPGFRGE